MHLTLVPPTAYPVPQALHTHELRPPTFRPRRASKVPEPWQRARRQLASVDLRQPDPLAADASAWWQFAVQAVEWNLELDEVIVTLVDGSHETWDLSPQMHPRSSPMVIDSDSEDAPGSPDLTLSSPPPTATELPPSSRWHPDAVSARLRDFAIKLRSAYEDLGTAAVSDPAAPDISSENDFRLLMLLAADPSRPVPYEWSDAQTMYEYAMMGIDEDERESSEPGAGRARSWRDELRRPSQGRRLDVDDPADSDPFEYTGQFRSRRRNTARSNRKDPTSRAYDYLSVIELLSQIRTYLCELFPATIIPVLRERLPPTYTLWAADGAIVWCRREAIGKARDAADLIVELLDDDGDHFDCTSKTASPVRSGRSYTTTHDIIVEDDAFDMLSDSSGADEWQAEERRQDRLVHNPLRLLRDDYELRKWCFNADERARMLEMGNSGSNFVSSPDWLHPVPSMDVARAFEPDSSDSERHRRRCGRLRLSHADPSSSPPSSPPDGDSLPGLSRSDSETETSDLDELADEDIRVSARRISDDFFYPPDPLGEGLLPRRLPKELVERNLQRGPELEEHREQLHHTLNQIAGLQSKIAELHGLVQRETKAWEEAQEENVQEGKTPRSSTTTSSRLKGPRTIPGPPPNGCRRRHPPKAGPPLRQQTGDRALERSLDEAYRSVDSPSMPKRVKASKLPTSLSRQLPRKRQRHNLETYSKLAAMSTYVLSDDNGDEEPTRAPKTKRRRLPEPTASEGKKKKTRRASGATQEARPTRPALVRGTRLQQNHGPVGPENGDPGALQSADRHAAIVGLSDRRRQVLQALTSDTGLGDSSLGSLDSNWLEAEISVDDESTEEHESRKNDEPNNDDDEVDELEEVEIDGLESRSEEDWPGLASQITTLLLQADGSAAAAEDENLNIDLEAPTRFPSPPLGALPSSSTGFAPTRTSTTPPPFSSSRLSPSPAYPVSAERSWQRLGCSSTPPPPLPLVAAHDLSSVVDGPADQQQEHEQFVVPAAFAVPRARVRNLNSPPAAAHREFSAEDDKERAQF